MYPCCAGIHEVKTKMIIHIIPSTIPIAATILQTVTANVHTISLTLVAAFAAYSASHFARARRFYPVTTAEAKQLWALHKLDTGCPSKKWKQIKHKTQTVGFQCQCGYRHVQRKSLVAHRPVLLDTAKSSAYNRLHTTYKSR